MVPELVNGIQNYFSRLASLVSLVDSSIYLKHQN